jgi:predicted nucleic acid-binding protein
MALVAPVSLDTTVLLAGSIDFGDASVHPMRIMDAVAQGTLPDVRTAWHCCLEFYAVATRLPAGYRLSPLQTRMILADLVPRLHLEQLPAGQQPAFLESAAGERAAGGRIYDAHIAEIARHSGVRTVVTDSRRHLSILMKYGVRVLRANEFAAELEGLL